MGSNPTPRIPVVSTEPAGIGDYARWAILRYSYSTVVRDRKSLKLLNKVVSSLDDQSAVVAYLQNKPCSVGNKAILLCSYLRYLKFRGLKPLYEILDYKDTLERLRPRRLAKIPKEDVARAVIYRIKGQTRNLLLLILNTGLRLNEALNLRWTQIDLTEGRLVLEQSEKRSEGSILPLSEEAKQVLTDQKKYTQGYEKVFSISERTVWKCLARARKINLDGADLVNPKNLRHIFATRLYARTKDLIFVQRMLRHRSILTTQRYVHYITSQRNFDVKVVEADDTEAIKLLLSEGYDVVLQTGRKIYLRRLRE